MFNFYILKQSSNPTISQTLSNHHYGKINVNILNDNNQAKKQELSYYEDKFQLKSQFNESPTKFGFQLNHTWVNVYKNESKSSVT